MTAAPSYQDPNLPVVLVIDDDPLISVVVRRAMDRIAHRMFSAHDGTSGIREVEQKRPDLIVLDNMLPDCIGIEVLSKIHHLAPNVPVIFVTARGSGSTAIEAMKLSAFDYLPKPLDPSKLRLQVERALSLRSLLQSTAALDSDCAPSLQPPLIETPEKPTSDALVGECPAMQHVFKAVGKVAMQSVPVLLRGEHGTGKEALAREIHRHSRFADGPFIKTFCPGRSDEQLKHELFGNADVPGNINFSTNGTLLLQEIGTLSLAAQGLLLQVLRDGSYTDPLSGESKPLPCRLMTTTTDDLEELVRKGEFRSDLYYLLTSFVITLPPLRQRHGDLPLLIARTLDKLSHIAAGFGIDYTRVSEDAMKVLCRHLWPGNIDELESVLKRAMVEQKGHILVADDMKRAMAEDPVVAMSGDTDDSTKFSTDWAVFAQMRIDSGTEDLHADAVEEMERKLFVRVLGHTGGNQAQAARLLGITRASLRKKLRQYGMSAQQLADSN
ncbi:sigma-54 dependent transcriptional regulator [Aeoliella sp. ICT_H6.2]|uniref:Sigma-54 dependent transcriptional regulator n=1 Tax=Aeoliella straminimaris TaxID=2954799 RepID=A0A9X2JHA6_9BACT|nr:sigma-54 dependent transcriptional regulator [Aeoliella straminimaris]MCO6045596.1 sigma-54 dependent transcriptional regulator [Aeoliella straminimaris]